MRIGQFFRSDLWTDLSSGVWMVLQYNHEKQTMTATTVLAEETENDEVVRPVRWEVLTAPLSKWGEISTINKRLHCDEDEIGLVDLV